MTCLLAKSMWTKIKECARQVVGEKALPWYERPGCKRYEHYQIRGGRRAARFPSEEFAGGVEPGVYPPDPSESASGRTRGGGPRSLQVGRPYLGETIKVRPGEQDGDPIGREALRRRKGPFRPYGAHTQSVLTREAIGRKPTRLSNYADQISRAIEKIRKDSPLGNLGFEVPGNIEELLEAGMPFRAASMLMKRTPRSSFFTSTSIAENVQLGLLTLLDEISQSLGLIVVETKELTFSIGEESSDKPDSMELQVEGRRDLGYIRKIYSPGVLELTAKNIEKLYASYVRQKKEESKALGESPSGVYRREFDPGFVDALFTEIEALVLEKENVKPSAGSRDVSLLFSRGETPISFPVGEHSKLSADLPEVAAKGY